MKQFVFALLVLSFFYQHTTAQSGNWVWLKGDSAMQSLGNYGIKGIASASNEPEATYQSAYWLDKNGDFWIFSGVTSSNNNALWKYSPSTNNWTWVRGDQINGIGNYGTQGVPSPLNDPPAMGFGANCWTDSLGDLWLFAGSDVISFGDFDNLWKYNIASNEWTWMKGSGLSSFVSNSVYGPIGTEGATFNPGVRSECKSGWVYNNKLWLFGGYTQGDSYNDIWSYSISNNQWAWQGGGQGFGNLGNYGTIGVPAATNQPPNRLSYTKWQDANNFYIFSGISMSSLSLPGALGFNDVWKFDKITKQWTWISGSNQADDLGIGSTYCSPTTLNYPQARFENQTAQTESTCINAFWTFGGFNSDLSSIHNDLWLFNTSNLEWTLVKGYTANGNQVSYSYGTKGVNSPTNLISPRGGPAVWSDASANLFVFGGITNSGFSNDLWKFIPDTACVQTGLVGSAHLTVPSNTTLCFGDTLLMNVPNGLVITISPNSNVSYTQGSSEIKFFGTSNTTYTIIATSANANDPCFLNDTVTFSITTIPDPIADFNVLPEIASIQNPTFTFTNTSTNATSYEWFDQNGNLISTSIDLVITATDTGTFCYKLVATNQCGRKSTKIKCVKVVDDGYLVVPNAFSPDGNSQNDIFHPIIIGNPKFTSYSFKVFNRWGAEVFSTKNIQSGWDGNYLNRFCEIGTYYYIIETNNEFDKKGVYKGDVSLIR